MFEILKALIALDQACKAQGRILFWKICDDEHGSRVLRAEVLVEQDDERFVEDMRALVGPIPENDPRL